MRPSALKAYMRVSSVELLSGTMNSDADRSPRISPRTSVTLIGSFRNLELPADFDHLFRDGVLVDPRNGAPMEMDAYSAYLALKAIERVHRADYSRERKILADAIIARMQDCGGFWRHGAWTGSHREIHMRFTAAALRLLCEALSDRIVISPSLLTEALKKHLLHSDKLEKGTWFLHDSLEKADTGVMHPQRPIKNRAIGSSAENCLVLNTHVDTLCTLIFVLKKIRMHEVDRVFFRSKLASGLLALNAALNINQGILWRQFAKFDVIMRKALFRLYSQQPSSASFAIFFQKVCRALIIRLYFPVRQRIRSRLHGFIFPDGYIERDIALDGTGFEYHLVNIYDLSRFLIQANELAFEIDPSLIDQCTRIIDKGIEYAINTSYWAYLIASSQDSGRAILLCETILARLATKKDNEPIPQSWIHAYCVLRRAASARSAAILGYDPFIVAELDRDSISRENWDVLKLRNGNNIAIDLVNEAIVAS